MGRSVTTTYRLEMTLAVGYATPQCWRSREYGRPSERNLRRELEGYNASLEPGGANQHIGPQGRAIAGRIVHNVSGAVVAEVLLGAPPVVITGRIARARAGAA